MTDGTSSMPTLGQRLDAQGRRLAARLLPSLPWAGPLEVLIQRATSLAAPFEARFERIESAPDRTDLGVLLAGDGGASRASALRDAWPPATAGGGASPAARRREGPAAGRPLPAGVRSRLREVAGRGADAMRVHDDGGADALARAHRADAVTVGRDVYFREGRFRPHEDRGFGLLAHEATHVLALLRPGAAWHRATGGGVRDEEEEALARERAAVPPLDTAPTRGRDAVAVPRRPTSAAPGVAPAAAGSAPPASPVSPAAAGPTPPASPAAHPMTAAEDRAAGPPPPPPLDLEALRRGLVNDLMRQLRTEFERGG